jgi:hypothetical protein
VRVSNWFEPHKQKKSKKKSKKNQKKKQKKKQKKNQKKVLARGSTGRCRRSPARFGKIFRYLLVDAGII